MSNSRCLGDVASIAYIDKLLSKYGNFNNPEGNMNNYNMQRKDARTAIELIITLSFMFGSKAMLEYTNEIKDTLQVLGIEIPDFNELSSTDYKLSPEITIYYTSGFNVFLSDNDYLTHPYKRLYLRHAKYINYRQLGIIHNIKHPLLQEELAAILVMVTSDNCEFEDIANNIGRLRFL